MALAARSPRPDCVLVETSGVALPGAVAHSVTLLQAFRHDATVVLADAETLRARAADRYLGDTVLRQLADADLVVLNKTDLATPALLADCEAWIRSEAPGARIVAAERGRVPPEVLLGADFPPASRGARLLSAGMAPPAARMFASAAFRPANNLDVARLGEALANPALGLLRAKGRLRERDGSWKTLQVVGARVEVTDAPQAGEAALVCIGPARGLDRRAIEALLDGA
jgi:G3E family GTPase